MTLLETLVAIGILALLAAIVTVSFVQFRRSIALDTAGESGISLLAEARARTLASREATSYGVRFEADRLILFRGTAYAVGDPGNEETLLSSGVEISDVSLAGGGREVVFERLTGQTGQSGAVTFRIEADPGRTRTISITAAGTFSL